MYSHLFQDRIVLFQFNTLRSIFLVFVGNVTAGTGQTSILMLCTFQNNLNAVAFLRHGFKNWEGKDSEFRGSAQCPFAHL